MDRVQLNVNLREVRGKGGARKVRAKDSIPGVIYGKGYENINVQVSPKEMLTAISGKSGMNTLIDLNVPQKGVVTVLLKDYQADLLTRKLTHLDFVKIDLSQKINVQIPIHYVGKSEGVKEGGILEAIRRELEVRCLPTAIPEFIEVDVSHLKVGQSLHLNDVKLPEDMEVNHDENFTLVSVAAPRAEEVAAPAEGTPAEPEVLTAKKPAEGESAPAADKKADKK